MDQSERSVIIKVVKIAVLIVVGLFLLNTLFESFVRVPVGYRGVATRFGAVTGQVRNEGIQLKAPYIDGNKNIEVRVQKVEALASAASKDLQTVSSVVSINYSVDPNKVISLYQNVGNDYDSRIIQPAIQESIKSITALFTAEHLITRRAEVSDQIKTELVNRLQPYGLIVADLNIEDFDFSESFNTAIENKVTAEQNALASKNKLEQIKYEATQAVEAAKGKAEAQRIEGEALRANPEVLQLRAIERWKGDVPTYWGGGALPFINVQ